MKVTIVDYKSGNISSVINSFKKVAKDEVNITFVGVHPLFQNQGIASLMVLSLLSRSKEIGISIATLEVKENNLAAKSLYESLNFRQIGFRNKLYKDGSNALIYQCVYN